MSTLTIELPETVAEQLQAYGISQQQVQNLVTTFMQNYLRQYQAQYAGDETNSPPSITSLSSEEISQAAAEQLAASLPEDTAADLAQLDFLADDDLWLAAQTQLIPAETEQMQALLDKQQLEGLTTEEQQTAQHLSRRYNRAMLIRAKAAVLLKERGYDISVLKQRPPVE